MNTKPLIIFSLITLIFLPIVSAFEPVSIYAACEQVTGNCIGTITNFFEGFTFKVTPQELTIPNCGVGSRVQVTVRNPFLLSSVNIYANKVQLCRIENNIAGGNEKTCTATIPAKQAGTAGTERMQLTIDAVGEKGSHDEGKGNSQTFSLSITHTATQDELEASRQLKAAKQEFETAQNKISTYETQFSMANARNKLAGTDNLYSQATQAFIACNFAGSNELADRISSNAQAAATQAEMDYSIALKNAEKKETKATANQSNDVNNLIIALIVGAIIIVAIYGYNNNWFRQKIFVKCSKCKTHNPEHHKRCHNCGNEL